MMNTTFNRENGATSAMETTTGDLHRPPRPDRGTGELAMLVAPVAAQATDQFSNVNSDSTFNGQTVNFGPSTQTPAAAGPRHSSGQTRPGQYFQPRMPAHRRPSMPPVRVRRAERWLGSQELRPCEGTRPPAVMNYTGSGTTSCGFTFALRPERHGNTTSRGWQHGSFDRAPATPQRVGAAVPSPALELHRPLLVANVDSAEFRNPPTRCDHRHDYGELGTGTSEPFTLRCSATPATRT